MRFNSVKKFVFGLITIWIVLIGVGLIFSHSFQNKIIDILIEKVDKNLSTQVYIRKSNIHFSVFKKFPLASLELRNVMIKIPNEFNLNSFNTEHGDTLLFAKSLFLQMNIRSLLNIDYHLKKISINNGFIQILHDKEGNSSLQILKTNNSKKTFHANIQSFSFSNVKVITQLTESKFLSTLDIKKGEVSGAFSESDFKITIKSNGVIEKIFIQGERLQPMQKYKIDVAVNKNNQNFSIRKGYFQISNIPMKIIGNIKTGESTFIDLVLSGQNISLKQLDKSFLNGLLGRTGFEPKAGVLNLQSTVKGYINKTTPNISANFTVKKARVVDKKKNLTYKEIYFKGSLSNSHNQHIQKSFSISIDTFSILSGNSKQYGNLTITNLHKPKIFVDMQGVLDIKDLKKYTSISGVNLQEGIISNSLIITGTIPQKEKYATEDIKVNGSFLLKNLGVKLDKFNSLTFKINGKLRLKDNNKLLFDSVYCQAANSDLIINGQLLNFNSTTATPVFTGSALSTNFYMTDFISVNSKSTNTSNAIQFPDSIKVKAKIIIKNFYFGNFTPQNINAHVQYNNKSLNINNLDLNAFSGNIKGNALIKQTSTSDIYLNARALFNKNNIEELFYGFNNFGQTIINSEHINGLISGTLQYSSTWNNNLKIDKKSILAQGDIILENGELKNYDPLMGLSKFIEVEELKHISFEKLSTNISIKNRKIILNQTHIASSAISFDGSGIHDFDNKYEYRLQVSLSDLLWRKARKKKKDISEFGYVIDNNSRSTTVPFIISGKGTSFNVKYDKLTSRSRFRQTVKLEKQELKELFQAQPLQDESFNKNDSEQIEQDKDTKLIKTDSVTYQNKTNEFILEWDDSEGE